MFGSVASSNLIPSRGITAYYDTTLSEYLTLSGSAITQFLDRSGNGNHTGVQGTVGARPTWTSNQYGSTSAAVFDGVANFLALPSALYSIPNGNNTLFVVSKTAAPDTHQRLLDMTKAGSGRYLLEYGSVAAQMIFLSRNANSGGTSIDGITEANANIFTCYRSGTTLSISVNGGAESTNTNGVSEPGIDGGNIGANGGTPGLFLNGSIGEIILYNIVLSVQERMQVERYLSYYFGVALV